MTKKFITTIAILLAALMVPATSYAQYEQEVIGVTTERIIVVHETIDTDISDYLNPAVIGASLILASGIFYIISRKAKVDTSGELIS